MRGEDLAGRCGGEEFLAILPGVACDEMAAVGARLVGVMADMVQQREHVSLSPPASARPGPAGHAGPAK